MNLDSLKKVLGNIYVSFLLVSLSLPHLLLADDTSSGGGQRGVSLANPINAKNIVELLDLIFQIITILLVPVAIFFLVRTGFYFVTAGGNKTDLENAKRDFLYVVIGIALIVGAQLIGAILQNTLVDIRRG